ncbi:MAG TPA: LTA synthase family protein [Gammaproteobacteria bacterium]
MSAREDAHDNDRSIRPSWRTVLAIVLRAPEIHAPVLLSTAGAVWSVHAGPFPAGAVLERWPLGGAAGIAALWLSIYFGAGRALLGAARDVEPRRPLHRLAVAMSLFVVFCAPLALVETLPAARLHYLKPLCWLAAAVTSAAVCFPDGFAAIRRVAGKRSGVSLVCVVLVSSAAAAVAVAAVDALLHVGGYWEAKYQLGRAAFVANTAVLACLHVAVYALLRRLAAAIIVVTAAFVALGFANLGKMMYMHAAVQPLDLLYVAELMPQLGATFEPITAAALLASCAAVLTAIVAALRRPASIVSWRGRAVVGGLAVIVIAGAATSERSPPLRRALEAAGIELAGWDSVRSTRQNGVLLEFLSLLPTAFVDTPARYSAAAVADVFRRYLRPGADDGKGVRRDSSNVTVIVYMIESLMDPSELGLAFTADPIPNLRALAAEHSSGYAVVPGRFGESASSEFELLTGMSSSFLPERSVAYKQYVKHRLPALPCVLKARGYRTAAVQADPVDFYNRAEVYRHLCFDHVAWLNEDASVARAINDRAPADDAIVDAVIDAADGPGPAFVFAFPSSTHYPYDLGLYADSPLDVADPERTSARAEIKYYINTLRVADAAVAKLVEHFAHVEHPVVIAIVGDHLPPLSSAALEGFYARLGDDVPALERILAERRVPLVVWSNFAQRREPLALSLNLLGPVLLERAGVDPPGFLGVVATFGKRLTMISRGLIGRASARWSPDAAPPEYAELLEDYRLLQHDVLFGQQFLAALTEPGPSSASSGDGRGSDSAEASGAE